MNESTDANRPSGPSPLKDALAFIEQQDETYTDEALYDALIDAGYPSDIASEALRQREADRQAAATTTAVDTGSHDERGRAALALAGGAVFAWLACAAILWVTSEEGLYGGIGIGTAILAVVLGLVLLMALLAAAASKSLRRGVQGALTTFLIIPFVFFFGLAGTCVVIMSGFE